MGKKQPFVIINPLTNDIFTVGRRTRQVDAFPPQNIFEIECIWRQNNDIHDSRNVLFYVLRQIRHVTYGWGGGGTSILINFRSFLILFFFVFFLNYVT